MAEVDEKKKSRYTIDYFFAPFFSAVPTPESTHETLNNVPSAMNIFSTLCVLRFYQTFFFLLPL